MNYRSRALAWVDKAHGTGRLPECLFDVDFSEMSDDQLEGYTHAMHRVYRMQRGAANDDLKAANDSGNRRLHLVPHAYGDRVCFIDRDTNTVYAAFNADHEFFGSHDAANMLGGKGFLSTVYNMWGDGDYFSDVANNNKAE